MKITRETLPKMFCRYCVTYQDCIPGDRFVNGARYCPAIKKVVGTTDKICKDFSLAKDFWCDKFDYWLDITVCVSRRIKGSVDGCTYCKQGNLIEGYSILMNQKKGESK